MSTFGKIFAVIMWIVIVICIFCAIYSAIGATFLEAISAALSEAIKDVAWGWWLAIAVCAYALGCLLAPESMAAITDRVANGLVHLANSAARVVRGVLSAAVSAIPTSVWVLLAVGVGIWLVSKSDGSSDKQPAVVYSSTEKQDDHVQPASNGSSGAASKPNDEQLLEERSDDNAVRNPSEEGGSDVLVV